MNINSIKTKDRFHNFIRIKQLDNTSPIEVLLCDSNGTLLSGLNEKCTVSIYDAISREVRQVSDEQIVDGVLSFKIVNELLPYTHKLEVTTFSGVKFPADDDFQIFVSESHNSKLINVIKSIPTELALKVVTQQVMNRFNSISDNFVNYIKKGEVTVNDLDVRERKITKEYISDDLINSIQSSEALSKENQSKFTSYVKKGEVTVSDINTNLGKIGLKYLSDDAIKAIAGNAPVNAVVGDGGVTTPKLANGAVSFLKTNFLKRGKNIFNKDNVQIGKLLDRTTGKLVDHTSYVTEQNIEVLPNQVFTQNYGDVVVFKDASGKFISGLARTTTPTTPRTFTTPSNAYFMDTSSVTKSAGAGYDYTMYQIELGTTSTSYSDYEVKIEYLTPNLKPETVTGDKIAPNTISGTNIKNSAIIPQKLSFFIVSTNIFNKAKVNTGYYVNNFSGALSTNTNYSASDYIVIEPSTQYIKNNTLPYYAFYDMNKTFISTTTTSTQTFTTPANAVYVRVSCLNADLSTFMLVKGATLPPTYQKFEEYIDPSLIKQSGTYTDSFGKNLLRKFNAQVAKWQSGLSTRIELILLGDSWTDHEPRFAKPLREKLKAIYGDGGIGYISFANNEYGNGAVAVGTTGAWKHYDAPYDSATAKSINTSMIETTTAGDTAIINISEESDYIEINFLKQTGTWRYNVDGAEWTTVDSSTTDKVVLNMSLAKHKINFEHLTGTTTLLNAVSYKGEKGVVVHCVGNGGLKASDIVASDRTNWITQFAKMNIQTANIMLGTNDMSANVELADFKNQIKEIVSRVREGKPGIDVTLCSPSGNNLTGKKYTMKEYDTAIREVAQELNCAFLSLYDNLGDYATANANGLMQDDGVHPNELGGHVIANTYYDRLLRI